MKILVTLLITISLLFSSCSKGDLKRFKKAEVEFNCTGAYLEVNGKYFRVCNREMLDSLYQTGDEIDVKFVSNGGECQTDELILCEMYFPYKRDVEILEIK